MSQVLDAPPPASRTAPPQPPAPLTPAELAAHHGLTVSGARPSPGQYVRQLWGRRHFITAFATAKLTAQYSEAKLGQVWQLMTPLLNAAVYYFIFGILMGVNRGIPDYIPFLVTGVFVWSFTSQTVTSGTRAISGSLGLVRALHFPRASLPIAYCIQQLQQLVFSMGALAIIVVCFGVPITGAWLLAVPALFLQTVFNTGLALLFARLGSKVPDTAQLMPFILRVWMYMSGVMYSLSGQLKHSSMPHWVGEVMQLNPASIYLDLMRFALIDSFKASQLPPHVWVLAAGWALAAGIGGFIYFWRGEEEYGRG
ncbi:ABC transporter permease [Actinomycetota bacterium Odt1-20B]